MLHHFQMTRPENAVWGRFLVLLVFVLCLCSSHADRRRAVHFFALRTQTTTHHNLSASPVSPSAIQSFISETTSSKLPDCSSLASEYVRTYGEEEDGDKLKSICHLVTSCQTPAAIDQLLALLYDRDVSVEDAVVDLCPVLLRQVRDTSCEKEAIVSGSDVKNSPVVVWGMAFLCVTIISLTSLVGVVIVPFLNKTSYLNVLNLFEGLAVGSLVGSALFHLIPQSFDLHTSPNKHDNLWKAFIIFVGIYLFYWSERIMSMISSSKNSANAEAGDMRNGDPKSETETANESLEQRIRTVSDVIVGGHTHAHEHAHLTDGNKKIATVAWMIIFGDGLHNFIDGLSIGAAFNESILTGISICVAVVCEEFPHELGDFAVLIASGMSVRQAVGYNFLSACTW